ncbi:MAG: restriction endonuclease subunit S [Anaerolineales bacterium]|nr:restriction endonuclease subunit S [Anaerolineales bacterium]
MLQRWSRSLGRVFQNTGGTTQTFSKLLAQVGVPSIAQPVTYLRTIELPLPPLPEQRAIAHILGTLDDKIELNRRMSQTLEAMARALFKAWFVDFEPVRAKMEGRWRRGESLPGLPAELYDLFPDRLVPSELGEIPEGWRVGCVDDAFNITMGQSPPGMTYNESGEECRFIKGGRISDFAFPSEGSHCTAPTRLGTQATP